MNRVVPRAELEKETLALAQRIARQDLLSLRVTKSSINNAQDAMGYRTMTQAAHSSYMVLHGAMSSRRQAEMSKRTKHLLVERAMDDE